MTMTDPSTFTPDPTSQAKQAASEIERLREVLYGDQARQTERQIADLESGIETLRRELNDAMDIRLEALAAATSQAQALAHQEIAGRFEAQTAQLQATHEALTRQLKRLATNFRSQVKALRADISRHFDRLSAEQAERARSPQAELGAPRSVKESSRWADAIRRWKHVEPDPKVAQALVTFFRLAFEWLPEQSYQAAWFGVHADHISLTVGNIQLASASAATRQVQLLVDQRWHKPAKSTRKYIPLGWRVRSWTRLADWTTSPQVWTSYAAAAEKVWATPHARAVIRRNLARKRPLRAVLHRAARSVRAARTG